MATSEIIVGLDIGTTKIAAIVGRKNQYGKIEILGSGKADSIGVNRGVVVNIEKTIESKWPSARLRFRPRWISNGYMWALRGSI
jgi:hypothetical protein